MGIMATDPAKLSYEEARNELVAVVADLEAGTATLEETIELWERGEALAIGFGMNARGAMEIILGLIALENGLITEKLFVALVVMALVTSMTSGPLMKWALKLKSTKPTPL
jgi:Kef-type K+ transport system membrane component KefB